MTYTPPKKRHWEKFNFAEWRNDDKLRKCSRGARSLWLDMCGLIYEADAEGRLILEGKSPDHMDLARYFKENGTAVKTWLDELKRKGVFDVTDDGYIVSRRISRELLRRQIDSRNGKKGGNPALLSKGDDHEGVKAKSQSQSHIEASLAAGGITPPEVQRVLASIGPAMPNPDTGQLADYLAAWLVVYDLEADIIPVLKAKTAKPKAKPIASFSYFADALTEHHANRKAGLFASQPQKSVKPEKGKSELIALPGGRARVAAHAIIEECGEEHYRSRFSDAEWNGSTVTVAPWNINAIKPAAREILAEEGFELVARH